MADWDPRTNGTLRGFILIVAVAAGLTAAGAAGALTLAIVFLVLRIAFIVVIGIVLFGLWRRNREDIAAWPLRTRVVFYGGALLAFLNLLAAFVLPWPAGGLEALVFFFVLAASGFAMWRAWREQHSYGY